MHRFESSAEVVDGSLSQIIFVIGPPRSGTTLTYQVLSDAFDVGYISNAHAKYYGGISYFERFFRPLKNKPPSDFHSNHGLTIGRTSPHECGQYWYQFFRKTPTYQPRNEFSDRDIRRLRSSLFRIQESFGRPVIFKNVMNSARLQVLREVVPEAVFIWVTRDLIQNAKSIIQAKTKSLGRDDVWWSLEPKGFEQFQNGTPEEQALQQVLLTHKMIENDLENYDPKRVVKVRYENLCEAPSKTLGTLFQKLQKLIPSLENSASFSCPEKFEMQSNGDRDLLDRLKRQAEDSFGG